MKKICPDCVFYDEDNPCNNLIGYYDEDGDMECYNFKSKDQKGGDR